MSVLSRAIVPAIALVLSLPLGGCLYGDLTPRLEDTRWALTGWSVGTTDPVRFRVSLEFDNDRFGGKGPVNQYGGSFSQDDETGCRFSRPVTSTRAAEPDFMAAEEDYFRLLSEVRTCRREGGVLILSDEAGKTLMVYSPLRE